MGVYKGRMLAGHIINGTFFLVITPIHQSAVLKNNKKQNARLYNEVWPKKERNSSYLKFTKISTEVRI